MLCLWSLWEFYALKIYIPPCVVIRKVISDLTYEFNRIDFQFCVTWFHTLCHCVKTLNAISCLLMTRKSRVVWHFTYWNYQSMLVCIFLREKKKRRVFIFLIRQDQAILANKVCWLWKWSLPIPNASLQKEISLLFQALTMKSLKDLI